MLKVQGKTLSLRDFATSYRSTILETCDIEKDMSRGRQKATILGGRPAPIALSDAFDICAIMVGKLKEQGVVLEQPANASFDLHNSSSRRSWVKQQMAQLRASNRQASDEDPFLRLRKKLPKLICIGERNTSNLRKEKIYIKTLSATPIELRIFANTIFNRSKREMRLGEDMDADLKEVIGLMQSDERLDEAMARHFDAIGRGEDDDTDEG
jgi:hypothetical protein